MNVQGLLTIAHGTRGRDPIASLPRERGRALPRLRDAPRSEHRFTWACDDALVDSVQGNRQLSCELVGIVPSFLPLSRRHLEPSCLPTG